MKGFVIVPFLLPLAIMAAIAYISIHFDGAGSSDPPAQQTTRQRRR